MEQGQQEWSRVKENGAGSERMEQNRRESSMARENGAGSERMEQGQRTLSRSLVFMEQGQNAGLGSIGQE